MLHKHFTAQNGSAIMTAIFLVVILAALGAFMVKVTSQQGTSAAQDIQGSRAYQAARVGVEWGAYQVLRDRNGVFATACRPGPTAPQTLPALAGAVSGFTVSVVCEAVNFTEAGILGSRNIYQITATATSGTLGKVNYVERQLRLSIDGL